MSRASILIVVGVLAILAPFSGLPVTLRTLLAVVLGCVVIGIGVAERSREQRRLVALQGAAAPARELEPTPVVAMAAPAYEAPAPSPVARRSSAAPAPRVPQPEIAIMVDIAPSAESAPVANPTPVLKPRARKAAPKTMSPI